MSNETSLDTTVDPEDDKPRIKISSTETVSTETYTLDNNSSGSETTETSEDKNKKSNGSSSDSSSSNKSNGSSSDSSSSNKSSDSSNGSSSNGSSSNNSSFNNSNSTKKKLKGTSMHFRRMYLDQRKREERLAKRRRRLEKLGVCFSCCIQ